MLSKTAKLLTIVISFFIFFFSFSQVLLAKESFVNIVNPVRGNDFWSLEKQKPEDAVKEQLKIIKENNFSATWLLRPDVIFDNQLSDQFKNFSNNQEIGLFLEVTPVWADKADVDYHQTISWHYANSVFLSGYKVEERYSLIDTVFTKFKEIFGYYPKSVGAWHIDANSLSYMEKKYGIKAALICADQFATDDYQIWGSWWSFPYYPSRYNVLIPAQTIKNKLNLVIFQWAARDPVNGYGSGVKESTFSVQANDYFLHGLNTDYFSKLIDFYLQPGKGDFGQITIGLENDYLWSAYGQEYANQLKVIKEKGIKTITMSEFYQWYQQHFPKLSPLVEITGEDILGSGKKSTWLMSDLGRINFLEENGQKNIRDLRNYNEEFAEPYLQVANQNHQLKINLSAQIDTVRFPEQGQKLETNPEKLIQKKVDIPFQTPKIIFFLMAIIFIGFLIISWCLNKWLFGLMFFGIIVQSLTMVKSGLLSSFGMSFWGANGHDGIWHIALINELTRNFPPQNMVFAHFNLLNYHWFFNLTIALIHKITFLPVLNIYFQIIPIVFAALLGILTFVLVKKISKNNLSGLLAVFFAFFGGSFGWLVTLARHQGIGGESLFWANQSISILINPPFAFSLLLILWGLIVLYQYLENFNHKKSWIRKIYLGLIFGLIIGFKAYGGLIVLAGLAFAAFWELVFEKKTKTLIIFLIALAISLIIFLPNNKGASSLFVWSPLWFPRTMLTFTDRLGWLRLSNARQVYATTHQWLKWFLAEGLALFIFLIGNLGSRFIGSFKLLSWLKNFRKINSWERMFLGCLSASLIAPLLFIQKGNPWNSLQFFYYFLFFSGLLTSFYLGEFLNKKTNWLKIIIILVVAGLTLPTTWGALKHYLPSRAPAKISFSELEGLDFLRKQPRGIVLTYPHDYQLREKAEAPKPLYIYETTAYVSAFTNKQTFLEDEMNLEIMQVNWQPRRKLVESFFQTQNEDLARNFLKDNQIRYIYLVDDQKFLAGEAQIGLKKIFDNGNVKIYEVSDKIITNKLSYEKNLSYR